MWSEIEDGQGKGVKPRINRCRRETENEIKKEEGGEDMGGVGGINIISMNHHHHQQAGAA